MAEPTEPQRLWESWYQAFAGIQEAWPRRLDVRCPHDDGGSVRVAYIGDPLTRRGTAFVWCDVGRHGIYLTRVGRPSGAEMLANDAPDAEQDALVPPDIDFLRPDPAPPGGN